MWRKDWIMKRLIIALLVNLVCSAALADDVFKLVCNGNGGSSVLEINTTEE
jgi:hypothetical protein